jgi:hypothetical protein
MRTWPDLRRITTCGQLVLLLYDSEELVKDEAEDLLAIVLRLVAELAAKCPMALDLEETLAQPMRLAGESTSRSSDHCDRPRSATGPAQYLDTCSPSACSCSFPL